MLEETKWTTIIKAKNSWFDINLKELAQYKDLIFLFVKRNYASRYKQTILGPLWLIVNPLITTLLYSIIFGNIAGLSAEGVPQITFYLASNAIWSFFATCLNQTATTFTANADIFGKIYFPRLTTPISTVITSMLDIAIQLVLLVVLMLFYIIRGWHFQMGIELLLVPVLIIQVSLLALGFGTIISSLTTKYRDLAILVTFGVQLWMYASPVVYTLSIVPEQYTMLYLLNPMAPIITMFRHVVLGIETAPYGMWGISWITTLIILVIGVLIFNKIEKSFMDTV